MSVEQTLKERGDRYGPFEGHAEITQYLKAIMRDAPGWDELSYSQAEALEMIAHKIARILNGDPNYPDNWHDIAGYASIVERELTKTEVKKMMNSNDVLNIQKLLKQMGYYTGAIDGVFGPISRAALHYAIKETGPKTNGWRSAKEPKYVARIDAFLDMIAYAEGTIRFGNDNGYNVIVGGTLFGSYKDHPRILVTLPNLGIKSTAAGRYQILSRFWDVYRKQLDLPDFGPDSQDRYAIQQICEQGAYGDVVSGNFDSAIRKCANIWASLPGAGYGQREVKREELVSYANNRLLKYQGEQNETA